MASDPSLIFTNVDYNAQGKQVDWLYLPHSVTRSAYGALAIPIAVIRNGDGPTVFLMSGNHGDEYEGQITLAKLIRELEPEQVRGRIIILPAANLPAAMAGTRVSPIDQGNLNRAFPGDPQGTPTWAIAHYIDSVLYPLADFHHDLHSGGSSLKYVPFCSMRNSGDPALDARIKEKHGQSCRFARACGDDLIGVDCNAAADGPYHYVRRADLEIIASCGGACMGGNCTNCPPEGWTCEQY